MNYIVLFIEILCITDLFLCFIAFIFDCLDERKE